jgi:hypothetical protein
VTDKESLDSREAVRVAMVREKIIPNLPIDELSDHATMLVDNQAMMERETLPYGGVDEMLKAFESEFADARSYSVPEFIAMLRAEFELENVSSQPDPY